jgi:hypothetical protein
MFCTGPRKAKGESNGRTDKTTMIKLKRAHSARTALSGHDLADLVDALVQIERTMASGRVGDAHLRLKDVLEILIRQTIGPGAA